MTPDKTSALVTLRGVNARTQWTKLLQHDPQHPSIPFQCSAHDDALYLPVVADYVYFEVLQDGRGHPAAEVKRRFLLAKPMLRMLQKGVFKSNQVPISARRTLYKAFLYSKIAFGAGAWQQMHVHTMHTWHTQMLHVVTRVITKMHRGPGVSNLDLIAASQLPRPMFVLSQQRLALFSRVMQTEMTELFAMLQAQKPDSSWLQMVCNDITRMHHLVPDEHLQTLAQVDQIELLARHVAQCPKALINYAKKASKIYCKYLRIWVISREFLTNLTDDLRRYDITTYLQDVPVQQAHGFACHECEATLAHLVLCVRASSNDIIRET